MTCLGCLPSQIGGLLVAGMQPSVEMDRHLGAATRTAQKTGGAAGPRDAGGAGLKWGVTAEAGGTGGESPREFGQTGLRVGAQLDEDDRCTDLQTLIHSHLPLRMPSTFPMTA
jgi:hypothetical protein